VTFCKYPASSRIRECPAKSACIISDEHAVSRS
jgi:hypothetical protein